MAVLAGLLVVTAIGGGTVLYWPDIENFIARRGIAVPPAQPVSVPEPVAPAPVVVAAEPEPEAVVAEPAVVESDAVEPGAVEPAVVVVQPEVVEAAPAVVEPQQIDAIEEISDGRVILGLGAGWNDPEYTAFGLPFDKRVSRFEEAFTIIRTLLQEGAIDFDGEYYSARDCELAPRGPRAEGPPLMIGSQGKRMLRISLPHVQSWNAWLCLGDSRASQVPALRNNIDTACRKVAVDPAAIERTVSIIVDQSGRHEVPASMDSDTTVPLTGSPEEIAAGLQAFADEGIRHIQIYLVPNTLETIELFRKVLEAMER